jgi:dihydrofolate reductase
MRKIFSFIATSVDGYYEGPNQEFDRPIVDEEFNRFSVEQLDEVDTLLFGRVTYEGIIGVLADGLGGEGQPADRAEIERCR